jgi:hypothetical protein
MVEPCVFAPNIDKSCEANLRDYGSQFARGSRDTMASRAIASGEDFAGYYESSRVWAKVLEEVGHTVEEDERFLAGARREHGIIPEAHATEYDS